MSSPLTPEEARTAALERAVAGATELTKRLRSTEAAGVLSTSAADAIRPWADRVDALIANVPAKPAQGE